MDSWYGKKSVVDVIFRVGHWNEQLAKLYREDKAHNPRTRAPADSQGDEERAAQQAVREASDLRRHARYERRRRKKWANRMTSY